MFLSAARGAQAGGTGRRYGPPAGRRERQPFAGPAPPGGAKGVQGHEERSLVLLAAGGLVLGAVGTVFVLTSDHEDNKGAFLSLALTVGLSFLVSGVLALWRRPENRTGALLVAVAYFWFLGGLTLSNDDWVFTLRAGQQPGAGGVRPSAAGVPVRAAPWTARPAARDRHYSSSSSVLLRNSWSRNVRTRPLVPTAKRDRRHRQRHRLDDRWADRRRAGAGTRPARSSSSS